jgi:hypothetical protein
MFESGQKCSNIIKKWSKVDKKWLQVVKNG